MCGPTPTAHPSSSQTKLLLRLDSFLTKGEEKKNLSSKANKESKDGDGEFKGHLRPSLMSTWLTVFVVVLLFIISEQLVLRLIESYLQPLDPVFHSSANRGILARHIGVDAFASLIVSYLGYINRHLIKDVLDVDQLKKCRTLKGFLSTIKTSLNLPNTNSPASTTSSSVRRIFSYSPEGHQVLIYFLAYQLKNLYDTLKWGDGILFVLHHILAGAAAYVGMYPGVAAIYGAFFMGMSEISTCILCLLANFDDEFGVVGLQDVYPNVKVALGVVFIINFIIFRIVLWPVYTFHFVRDAEVALGQRVNGNDKVEEVESYVKYSLLMLVNICKALSFLQIIFLGQIIYTTYVEAKAMIF